MPYTAKTPRAIKKLIGHRWVDAFKLFQWAAACMAMKKSFLSERRAAFEQLNKCFIRDVVGDRMAEGDLRIDSMSSDWMPIFLTLQNYLNDKAVAEHKPGSSRVSASDEVSRADANLSRAYDAALLNIVDRIDKETLLVDRNAFEDDLIWNFQPHVHLRESASSSSKDVK